MSPDSVLHMLHRVLKRAGLPKVRFHDLRHTFATLALQNGVDVKTVSGMLGHFSAGFTLDTYAHVTTSAKREAAKTMGNILSGAVNTFPLSRWGQRLGQKNGKQVIGHKSVEKVLISCEIRTFWLRRQDSNLRPPGYELDAPQAYVAANCGIAGKPLALLSLAPAALRC